MSDLAAEGCAYQAYLEAARTHPDDVQLAEDLDRAHRALVLAWLEALHAEPSA